MYKEDSLVSIIVRTKDRPFFLKRAINSIKNQTYKIWEVVIVNNGGNSELVLSSVNTLCRFKIINIPEPKLMEYATNVGIKESKGKYITLLDDDDTWEENFLQDCVNFLESTSYAGVVCKTKIIFETVEAEKILYGSEKILNSDLKKINIWALSRYNQFTTNSFMYKKEVLEKVGLYDESFPVLGDWDFNIRFVLSGYYICIIDNVLANYHKRINSEKYRNSNLEQHFLYEWIIRKKFFFQYILSNQALFAMWILGLGIISKIKRFFKEVWVKRLIS